MTKNKKIYFITFIIIFIAAAAGFGLYLKNNKKVIQDPESDISGMSASPEQAKENNRIINEPLKEAEVYRNLDPLFSFSYPKGLKVGEFEEGESGQTILIQKPGTKIGIQIYYSPFDEDVTLTADRIKKDLPDTKMDSVETWNVGALQAVSFVSENSSFGKTREVWFVYDKNLYQITTYFELSDFLKQILATWKFD